jgi:hypothetical protein
MRSGEMRANDGQGELSRPDGPGPIRTRWTRRTVFDIYYHDTGSVDADGRSEDLRRKISIDERGLRKPHATLFQADELFPGAQDQVIQHLNRQVVSGFNDLPRNTDILRRGGCLARRMIMYYHDTGSVDSDGRPEDLRRPYHDAPHSRVGCQRVALAGTFPTAPLRTGRDTFASSGSPETYFLLSCCDIVPAWIASWQLWQTIRVFRRLAIMVCIQTGFSFRPFLF